MIRVLRVTDHCCDHQTRIGIAQLAHAGLLQSQTIRVNTDPVLAVRDAATLRRDPPKVNLVHAYGINSLKIAAFAWTGPILFNPTGWPDRSTIRWLRAISEYRNVHVVVSTETGRRRFVENGIPLNRCHIVQPGVDFGRIDHIKGRARREMLGFTRDERVILAVGESACETDHFRAVWAAVVLHVLDNRNRILLWGRGPLADSVRRFANKLGQPGLITVATDRLGRDIEFDELMGIADVALVTNALPAPTLPIAMCMAAGMAIVSTVDSTICELLEDRHNALLCTSRGARPIARRILDLQADADGQWARSGQARAEAFEKYSKTRYVEAMLTLCETILN